MGFETGEPTFLGGASETSFLDPHGEDNRMGQRRTVTSHTPDDP